jgi:hypothetical protein
MRLDCVLALFQNGAFGLSNSVSSPPRAEPNGGH